jgi:hypothetical protein
MTHLTSGADTRGLAARMYLTSSAAAASSSPV